MDISQHSIIVFGDSIAAGIVTDNGLSRLKENAVSLVQQHFNTPICNQSSFGMTLSRLTQKGIIDKYIESIDKSKKNLAVLAIGGNDADFDWSKIQLDPLGVHLQKTPLPVFRELLIQTIQKFKQAQITPMVVSLPPMNPIRYIESLYKIADKQNIMAFLRDDVFFMYKDQERYSAEITRVAAQMKCALIDLRCALLTEKYYNKMLCNDGIHPNQEGQRKIGEIIIDIIQNDKIINI